MKRMQDERKKERTEFGNSIIGICHKVYSFLGVGLTENIYENAICNELQRKGIKYTQQEVILIKYYDICVGNIRADICIPDEKFCLELKAIDTLHEKNNSQLIQQLSGLNYESGVLFNFNQKNKDEHFDWVYVWKGLHKGTPCYYANDSKDKTIIYNLNGILL